MQADGTYKGFLSVSFNGTPGGPQGATCGGGNDTWSWPVIDQIAVLGVGPVNGDSITVQVMAPLHATLDIIHDDRPRGQWGA